MERTTHPQNQQEEEVENVEKEVKKKEKDEQKDGVKKVEKRKDEVEEKEEKVEENQGGEAKRVEVKEEQDAKGKRVENKQHQVVEDTFHQGKDVSTFSQGLSLQEQSPLERSPQEHLCYNQPQQDQSTLTQSHRKQLPKEQPHQEQSPKEQHHQEQSAMEQAPQEQPLKEEAPQEQLSKQQPHQEQPPKEQPRQDQSDQAQSFQGDVKDKGRLTVLTWNIDGLDPEDILERLKELISTLQKYCPDVILLQELIPPIVPTLLKCLKTYDFLRGKESGYFTGIMLRKSRVQLLQKDIVNYPTTEMGRNLLMAQVKFFDHNLCVMTSHLESCKESSQERLNQLRRVWKRMREADESLTVIFGGDTNLRDWEVKKLGGLPEGISDVWELLGQPEDCRYTWDTTTNNNKDLPFPARLRFDRVFIRAAKEGAQVVPETMVLVGQERLSCGRFTSDHWAILCTFSITEGHDGPPQNSS